MNTALMKRGTYSDALEMPGTIQEILSLKKKDFLIRREKPY
jgi:hypothetical protein